MSYPKICFKCGNLKGLDQFYKHPKMADGHLNKCKDCTKKDTVENYFKNNDYYKKYDAVRDATQKRIDLKRSYQKTDNGKKSLIKYRIKWLKKNKKKRIVHLISQNALNRRDIIKDDKCSSCGKDGKLNGHHDDYDFPLIVRWLCSKCHSRWHKENGEGKNCR